VNKSSQIEESIIQILNHHKEGLGISEISKKIHIYRATVSKYLMALQHREVVSSKKVGPAKIYYLKRTVHHNSSPNKTTHKHEDWIDEFLDEIKDEIKKEIMES